ncbi:Imm1 family immunity protein [Candidatus Thiodiazotropha sp. LNASS1]|uniref:Imm1 family immunity protein n=1 Tax=Candidatus Thiodiazotropha sp. LNASS1 TaxID=3096260 RepID=UPI0034DFE6C9
MFVDKIYEDDWSGVKSLDAEYTCADFNQVESAIRRLNGKNKTMVVISSSVNNKALSIAGGNDGKYIAYLAVDVDDKLYNLTSGEEKAEKYCDIVAGGQSGSYPVNQCLDILTIIKACRYFTIYGEMDPDLIWELQE